MNQQKSHLRKQDRGMQGIKYVILSMGLTSILGFWGLFSRQAAAASTANPTSDGNTTLLVQPTGANAITLPPMPTLVPPGAPGSSQVGSPSNQTTWNPQSLVTLFFGSGNSLQVSRPAPVVTTRSSR